MQGTKNELKDLFCKREESLPYMIFAKSTAYVLLYLLYSIVIYLIFPAIFVYPMAYNIVPLFALLTVMYYAATFFAYTISYFFKTRESALLILVVTSLMFIFLPGFIWPKEAIPMWINVGALFIPATCGVDAIIKLNQMGASFWDIKYDFIGIVFLAILYFTLSIFVLKKNSNDIDKKYNN